MLVISGFSLQAVAKFICILTSDASFLGIKATKRQWMDLMVGTLNSSLLLKCLKILSIHPAGAHDKDKSTLPNVHVHLYSTAHAHPKYPRKCYYLESRWLLCLDVYSIQLLLISIPINQLIHFSVTQIILLVQTNISILLVRIFLVIFFN